MVEFNERGGGGVLMEHAAAWFCSPMEAMHARVCLCIALDLWEEVEGTTSTRKDFVIIG